MTINTLQLGTEPIVKLFWALSLPMIASTLVAGLYNVVDALFIARVVGTNAIGGITIALPLQMAIFSFSALIGAGAASIIARQLGSKDDSGAMGTMGNALFLSILGGSTLLALMLIFIDSVFNFLRVTDELHRYANEYLTPILWGAPVAMLVGVFSSVLGAEGKMKLLMILSIFSSVLNILLDWFFIVGLDWGVSGAAIATVITQTLSLCIVLYFYLAGKTHIKIQFKRLKPWTDKTLEMLSLGLPIFITSFGVLILVASVNYVLTSNSHTESTDCMIGAYGILCRVFVFVFIPMQGMIVAYQTICGFNYGAQYYDRVKKISAVATRSTTIYAAVCTMVMVFYPHWVFGIFTKDPALIDYGKEMSLLIFFGFFTTGAVGVWSIYFQAIGEAKTATLLSSIELYAFQLPSLYIIVIFFDVSKIWYAYVISDFAVFAIVFWVFRKAMVQLDMLNSSVYKKPVSNY